VTDLGVGSWLRKRSVKSAGATMIKFEGAETSYDKFAERVFRLAGALVERGIGRGDRVAYLGDNHPSFLETMFSAAMLGAIFVPLNTRLAVAEVAYALEDSGAALLVLSDPYASVGRAAAGAANVHQLIVVQGERGDDEYETLIASTEQFAVEQDVGPDDPALILYTSGTTGKPKGAVLSHGNLIWNALNVLVDYDLTSTDRALMVSPLFHVASLGMGTLPVVLKGATLILERRFDAERALETIEQERVTWLSGVPTTFQLLCESSRWHSTDLSSLRSLTCGGSPVPLRVIEAYESRGLAFTGGYGMTEASPGVTSLSPRAGRQRARTSGQPHFFVDVRITTPDSDGVGEIEVRGPNVMRQYWQRPDDTASAFSEDGWFKSGDLGFLDDDGYLTVSDRLKDMVISGGENIYPAEVELVIAELEDITGVAVIGAPDEKWGEVPIAMVTLRDGSSVDETEIRAYLDGRLARYKIPKRVFVVEQLPRTASGKVFKSKLRGEYSSHRDINQENHGG
jgi:fatty-acyl-CoA synthase